MSPLQQGAQILRDRRRQQGATGQVDAAAPQRSRVQPGGQTAAARVEAHGLTGVEPSPVGEGQQRRQGGVPAEGNLAAGGEPAQQPPPVLGQQEGGLGLAQASGKPLQPGIGPGLFEEDHGGAVAGAGALAEGLDQNGMHYGIRAGRGRGGAC